MVRRHDHSLTSRTSVTAYNSTIQLTITTLLLSIPFAYFISQYYILELVELTRSLLLYMHSSDSRLKKQLYWVFLPKTAIVRDALSLTQTAFTMFTFTFSNMNDCMTQQIVS